MTEIVYHKPPGRLAELMARPGAVRVSDALQRAENGLMMMQDACTASIAAASDRIAAALARLAADRTDDIALADLYAAADEVIGLAGPAGLEEVGSAAYSLCELADRYQAGAPVRPSAVRVHLEALRLLARPATKTGGPAARRAVLDGLKQVVRST